MSQLNPVFAVIVEGHEVDIFLSTLEEAKDHAASLRSEFDSVCSVKKFDTEKAGYTWIEKRRGY
jgi:hypothetical protein